MRVTADDIRVIRAAREAGLLPSLLDETLEEFEAVGSVPESIREMMALDVERNDSRMQDWEVNGRLIRAVGEVQALRAFAVLYPHVTEIISWGRR